MSRGRPKVTINIPKKPPIDESTRFSIDYSWWEEKNLSLESYLATRLGHEVSLDEDTGKVDVIDPQTAEVRQLSGFEFTIQAHFNQLKGDLLQRGSLVDAVFSVLLANGNRPMSAAEIAAQIDRPVDVIYKTLGSGQIYQGIRPHID